MSSRRPTQVPRWAWGNSASLVQPPTLSAAGGFTTAQRPPAPWFNWQFNALGAWVDYLRSPNVESWVRIAWATSPGSYDSSSPVLLAVDATTTDVTGAAYRMVIAGWETGPTSTLHVSQRGNAWTRRTNLPGGFSKPTALAHLSNAARWVIADDTPAVWYAPHDAGAGTSPVGGSSSGWVSCSGTSDDGSGALTAVKAFASNTSQAIAITTAGGLWSADGVTWAAISESTSRTGNGLDVVWDGANFVYVTSAGEIYASPTASGSFALKTTLAGGAADWRLAVGASGEVLAYVRNSGSVLDLYRSTNSGTSWSALTPVAPNGDDGATRTVIRLSCVRGHDGVWVATSTVAPFLWVSNDATNWTPLRMPVSGAGALQAVAWDGGAWVAAGNGWIIQCPRGADPSAGDYVADSTPSTLADAASLRGRRIETGTPSNGDTLVWNSSTELWEYSAGGGGGSPTTTRGDLIRRGASADQRLALGASGYVLTSDGTDPVWAAPSYPKRTVDPMTGTGWTSFSPGFGQSIVWASSKLTLTTPSGVNAGDQCGAYKSLLTSGESYDLAVRVKVTGANSDAGANLNVIVGRDYASNRLYFQMRFDGALQAGGYGGGVWVSLLSWTAGNTIGSSDRTGGELWFRIRRDRATIVLSTGVGSSGAVPTSWTQRHRTTSTDALDTMTAGGLFVTVSMDTSGPSTNAILEILDIRTVEEPVTL